MKFRRANKIEGKATAYGVKDIATGETVELEGHLAKKASNNPNYEVVHDQDRVEKPRPANTGKAGKRSNARK